MNKVLLGIVDEPIINAAECNYAVNKIGGKPDCLWVNESVKCKICGTFSVLVAQIYAPLDESKYHRTLYIFACIKPSCQMLPNRCQFLDDSNDKPNNGNSATDFLWCNNANDWGTDDDETLVDNFIHSVSISSNGFSNEIEKTNNQETPSLFSENDLEDSNQSLEFKPMYIYVIEEKDTSGPFEDDVKRLLQEYSKENDFSRIINKSNEELLQNNSQNLESRASVCMPEEEYEKVLPSHGDKLFHRFISRINKNPGQVIRYCRDNKEALFLYKEEQYSEKCKYCRGEMVFEVQILPTIIPHLRLVQNDTGLDNLEFGSVFVYTCKDSCWVSNASYREEHVILQLEHTASKKLPIKTSERNT